MYKFLFLILLMACQVNSRSVATRTSQTAGIEFSYSVDGKVVKYFGIPLDLDASTLKVLSNPYAKDAKSAYYTYQKLQDADVDSFDIAGNENFAKDAVRGYRYGKVLVGADGPSFVGIDDRISKDKNQVFYDDIPLADADPFSFRVIQNISYRKIFADSNAIICGLEDIDRKFTQSRLVLPDTREIRPQFSDQSHYYANDRYFTNGLQVFYTDNCRLLEGVVSQDFVSLESPDRFHYGFFGDRKSLVFFRDRPLPGVDALTFQPLDGDFSKDSTSTFYQSRRIPTADALSFVSPRKKWIEAGAFLKYPPDSCGGIVGKDKNRIFDPVEVETWAAPQ